MPLSPVIEKPINFLGSIATKVMLPALDGSDKDVHLITKTEFGNLKALAGYAKRDGFFGLIATVFHRVWNAVKGIFGQSDWQKAEKSFISVTRRFADYGYLIGHTEEEIALQKDVVRSPKYKKTAQNAVKFFVRQINQANKMFKPLEKMAMPIVDQVISMINPRKLGKNIVEIQKVAGCNSFRELSHQEKMIEYVGRMKRIGILKTEVPTEEIVNMINIFFRPQL